MLVREPDFCSYVYVIYSPTLCEVPRFKPKFRGMDVEILNVADRNGNDEEEEKEIESEEEKYFEFGRQGSRLEEEEDE